MEAEEQTAKGILLKVRKDSQQVLRFGKGSQQPLGVKWQKSAPEVFVPFEEKGEAVFTVLLTPKDMQPWNVTGDYMEIVKRKTK